MICAACLSKQHAHCAQLLIHVDGALVTQFCECICTPAAASSVVAGGPTHAANGAPSPAAVEQRGTVTRGHAASVAALHGVVELMERLRVKCSDAYHGIVARDALSRACPLCGWKVAR